jgi:hypothetical protein
MIAMIVFMATSKDEATFSSSAICSCVPALLVAAVPGVVSVLAVYTTWWWYSVRRSNMTPSQAEP